MILLVQQRPWVWLPILCALMLATVFGYAAFHYARKKSYPRTEPASGFKGMVRETAKFTLGATGASLIVGIVSKELAKYPAAQDALLAVLLISLTATILNYYMGASLDVFERNDGKQVKLRSSFWPIVHGIIFGLSLAALLAFLAAVIAFAIAF